jgi:hypothetical protein
MAAFSEINSDQPRRTRGSRFVHLMRIIPLFGPVLLVYALITTVGGLDLGTFTKFPIHLLSGATLEIGGNDLFLIGVVLLLFFELIKASNATQGVVFVEHILSTLVFVAFVVMLITVKACGNSTFLILTLISAVDVLAGWTITYRTALRDWAVER